MKWPLHHTAAVFTFVLGLTTRESAVTLNNSSYYRPVTDSVKIQAAILLDVSNSMDGLIDQAKWQLWNMVSVLGKIRCDEGRPKIEIALYEYGRTENGVNTGYVKQISGFTNDLDKLFKDLNELKTNGSEEYCGHVLYSALTELSWDKSPRSYKVIFIAGNESFLQGDISFTQACEKAKKEAVIINTVYCGDFHKGETEHWNLGTECGNGTYTNIDKDAERFSTPTPYDTTLIVLNQRLSNTYISYGKSGKDLLEEMKKMDTLSVTDPQDFSKVIKYKVVRADNTLYNKSQWDLIDANDKDSSFIDKMDLSTLGDSLRSKSRSEIKQIVEHTSKERKQIQKSILDLNNLRNDYIEAEKNKAKIVDPQTLETEIEKIIKEQIKRFNMAIR